MSFKCPGADSRFLQVQEEKCQSCGYTVEMFSDEIRLKCPRCGQMIYREAIPSCIDWCSMAKECIGEEKYKELRPDVKPKKGTMDFKEKILAEMVGYFGRDIKRIGHAMKVSHFVEKILQDELEADRRVVVLAAILHDIGIKECERKHSSTNGQLQEKEGPPIAREILERAGIQRKIIDEVCTIIASHHSPGEVNTLNFRILWDADCIVNLEEEFSSSDVKDIERRLEQMLLTDTGRRVAGEKYLKNADTIVK